MAPDRGPFAELPAVFGPFRLLRPIGGGGMGVVYLAEEPALGRQVALKVPRPDLTARPGFIDRFLTEARAAASLYHPNLCPVYASGVEAGLPYLTMPYLDGARPLSEIVAQFPGNPRRAAVLIRAVAAGVHELHKRGVIHRDLKPANILLDGRGEPIVVDFGLALDLAADGVRLTQAGIFVGTVAFAPPEQLDGRQGELDRRCDVYSLGAVLYLLLTGREPFGGDREAQLRDKSAGRPPAPSAVLQTANPACRAGVPAGLDQVCLGALGPRPEDRFRDLEAFVLELDRYLDDRAAGTSVWDAAKLPAPPPSSAPSSPAVVTAGPARDVTVPPPDPRVDEATVRLLDEWGWEEGLARLNDRIREAADPAERGRLRLLAAWLTGDRGEHDDAETLFGEAAAVPELAGWALVGRAFVALARGNHREAEALLDRVQAGDDRALAGVAAHARGKGLYRQARYEEALDRLFEADGLLGPDHFASGRVLDTLGAVYAARDDFDTALAFYRLSLQVKVRHNDLPGQAVTYGQMGRLYLDHGDLDQAESHLRRDLDLSQQTSDGLGVAVMYNALGRVALERDQAIPAWDYQTECLRLAEAGGWVVTQGYALKDRGRVRLRLGQPEEAEVDARRALELFSAPDLREERAHARVVLAQALAGRDPAQAERLLIQAAGYFDKTVSRADAARAWLEVGRLRRARGATPFAAEAYLFALERADQGRRDALVALVERELRQVDELSYHRWAFARVRGDGIRASSTALNVVTGERATVLFLDLSGFTPYSLAQDPAAVQRTLNQMFAELADILGQHRIVVNQYLGDGFMALVREDGHATRAVAGGLDMLAALRRLNRARLRLGKPELLARVGVCTGPVVLGNVGTPRKVDFTAVGPTTNHAARLQGEAQAGQCVCVAESTYQLVKGEFLPLSEAGRLVTLKGIGEVRVWDLAGRR